MSRHLQPTRLLQHRPGCSGERCADPGRQPGECIDDAVRHGLERPRTRECEIPLCGVRLDPISALSRLEYRMAPDRFFVSGRRVHTGTVRFVHIITM